MFGDYNQVQDSAQAQAKAAEAAKAHEKTVKDYADKKKRDIVTELDACHAVANVAEQSTRNSLQEGEDVIITLEVKNPAAFTTLNAQGKNLQIGADGVARLVIKLSDVQKLANRNEYANFFVSIFGNIKQICESARTTNLQALDKMIHEGKSDVPHLPAIFSSNQAVS